MYARILCFHVLKSFLGIRMQIPTNVCVLHRQHRRNCSLGSGDTSVCPSVRPGDVLWWRPMYSVLRAHRHAPVTEAVSQNDGVSVTVQAPVMQLKLDVY
jgi:hypothetical protein